MTAPPIQGYRYVEHLGSGGFADVFLYEQEWPRQRVAIKVVRPDVPLTDREKRLFTVEANAMAKLADHPYIVSVMTAGVTSEGLPYLVMRYCPPPDLGVRVRSNPMPVAEAVSTGIKLASAIETAHRSGIIHRDIKPSNVLVTAYSEPAITDFGIAGGLHDKEGDQEVRISYPWAPPEMLDGRSAGSVTSDVYSLGATIWHLLIGRSPFSIPNGDNSTRALCARILHSPAPATQRPDVPPALDRLLQQCLAKQPTYRPQSALELARSLQRIEVAEGFSRTPIAVEGDPMERRPSPSGTAFDEGATRLKPPTISGSAPRAVTPAPAPVAAQAPRAQRSWLPALLGAVGVAALVGLAAFLFLRAGDDPDPDLGVPTTSPSANVTVDPNAPTGAPVVTADRTGDNVRFAWASDAQQAGDTWQWKRTDTGEGSRTEADSLVLPAKDRVCIQVRLIRGQFASPWASKCAA